MLTAAAGFLLASRGEVNLGLMLATLSGTALIIACACVINNIIDQNIDRRMARTKQRGLITGVISVNAAVVYGFVLGCLGVAILLVFTNLLTTLIGLFGLFAYVVLYSYAKRHSVQGTLVGTISGSTPPVAGYTAVTGQIDTAAVLLFLILVCWQMPHFYAIALFRIKEYKAAKLPLLPIVKGTRRTIGEMLAYITSFILVSSALTFFGYTSRSYLLVMLIVGVVWLKYWLADKSDIVAWARKMFLVSLVVLLIWSVALSIDSLFV